MRHFKALGVAFAALVVLGVTATSAFATLPDISALAYPLHLNFADNGTTVTKLETTAATKLEGKGVLLLLLVEKLSELGLYLTLFLHVTNGTENCNTPGDAAGEVLLGDNEVHLVYPSLSPLTLGAAFLVKEFTIDCGMVEIKVKGCALAKVTHPTSGTEEVTLTTGELTGANGKNTLTEYDNAAGTGKVKCILLSNFGAGFLQSDENIGEAVHLVALEGGMFKISPI
jgi:hypothetical protein